MDLMPSPASGERGFRMGSTVKEQGRAVASFDDAFGEVVDDVYAWTRGEGPRQALGKPVRREVRPGRGSLALNQATMRFAPFPLGAAAASFPRASLKSRLPPLRSSSMTIPGGFVPGRNASSDAGGFPPASANAPRYASSHCRGLMSHRRSVWNTLDSIAATSPAHSAPDPRLSLRSTAGRRGIRSAALSSSGTSGCSTKTVSPS